MPQTLPSKPGAPIKCPNTRACHPSGEWDQARREFSRRQVMMVQIVPCLPCLTGAVAWLQPRERASPRYCLEPSQVLQSAGQPPTRSSTAASIPFLCPSRSPTHQLCSRGVPLSFCSHSCLGLQEAFLQPVFFCPGLLLCAGIWVTPSSPFISCSKALA